MQAEHFVSGNAAAGILARQALLLLLTGGIYTLGYSPCLCFGSERVGEEQKRYLLQETRLPVFLFAALLPHGGEGGRDGAQLFLCDLGLVFDEVNEHPAGRAKGAQ